MAARHIVALIAPAWGHAGPYCYLAVQMLDTDPSVAVSIVQHNIMAAQMEAELETCTYDRKRLRIIGVGEKNIPLGPTRMKEAFGQLVQGWMENIPRLAQGTEGWPKPQAVHFDFTTGAYVIEPTKIIFGPACKTLLWFSGGLVAMTSVFNEYDFTAIAQEIYSDESRREGRSLDEILQQVAWSWNGTDRLDGRMLKFPGAPDMYDHERVSHAAGPPMALAALLTSGQKLAKLVDGYISPTGTCVEPVGVQYAREYYKKLGQEVFAVGMQVHELGWTDSALVSPKNEILRSFLDKTLSQHGPGSALYISFGSMFFPVATPELIEALINTLLQLEQPFPFVFALGGMMASLPAELIQQVNISSKGLICAFWVEQRAILQHGAVGWFLTHGGFNSLSEALSQGIPLIIWPTGAEQPVNAALFSSGPNPVAIELMQIRTGPQRGPSLRNDHNITGTVEDASKEFKTVFDDARGIRGSVLKVNALKMAKALREARMGEASDEVMRLAKF
ncbi:hypothetical protein C8R43DRAFT_634845 [Mycena crocata]|nr:hypothetical protein C8R43DRAFT_634845 [Mycena crocata]